MIRATLGKIAAMIPGAAVDQAWEHIAIHGVGRDTRDLSALCLYIPLIGERFDGHAYVQDAMSQGAAASLWQRDHGPAPEGVPTVLVDDALSALQRLANAYRRELPVKVVGITGSNGKTSTKDMVHAVLSTTYRVHKTQGNLNNHIGLPLTLLELEPDTQYAVLEMGMSGFGEIELLSMIAEPDCAVITNIGDAHMLQLGSREGIAKAKLEITAGLQAGGALIYHGDEPLLAQELEKLDADGKFRLIRFGMSAANDFYPEHIHISLTRTQFAACRRNGGAAVERIEIPLPGRHNALNALAAVAVADLFRVPDERLRLGLAGMTPTGMRAELSRAASGAALVNDAYNASPASMTAALRLLEEIEWEGRKVAVVGDMLELGPEAERFHREIGLALEENRIPYVFAYGELGAYIAEECRNRYSPGAVEAFLDKQQLIGRLREFLKPDDLVLVKASRGMRLEEVVRALAQI